MKKYRITQADTMCCEYEVEAESEDEAVRKVQREEEGMSERGRLVDSCYEVEELE